MSKLGNWFQKKINISAPFMRDAVKAIEKDSNGNFWYLTNFFSPSGKIKNDYNLTLDRDKADSLLVCTPFSTVINKVGSLFANGRIYVTDKDGNEKEGYNDIRELLSRPNPLQTRAGFFKEIEMSLKLFGYCPIFTVRATKKSLPLAMYVIPAQIFHMVSSGKLFRQYDIKDIVSSVYLEWNGLQEELSDEDYFVIYDSSANVNGSNQDIEFSSVTDSLSMPVNNWIAAMTASYQLIVNGGPKGIIYSDYTDKMGNQTMTPEEKEILESKLKEKYGILNKFPILTSKIKLGWIPLNYDASQLKLHEEDERCSRKICNAIGIDYSLFDESKYDNKSIAEKSAYQGLIIPDSEKVTEALTEVICPKGVFIKLDYTHIDCLQQDKSASSSAFQKMASSLIQLVEKGQITLDESRNELAKFIDIDPDNPKGELKTNNSIENGQN
jgi:hypothetical protein